MGTLKKLFKIIVAMLGILIATACASLIVSPWGLLRPKEPVSVCSWSTPYNPASFNRYDFKNAVLEYRKRGYLEPPTFLISCVSSDPLGELFSQVQETRRWEQFEARIVAEVKRQEALEGSI